jgi:hypothetical protein
MKYLALIQAIVLTGLFVHNVHLEGKLRERQPLLFYSESNQNQSGQIEIPLNNKATIESEILRGQSEQLELLPDIQGLEDDVNNSLNHSAELFGEATETTILNKVKTKSKSK